MSFAPRSSSMASPSHLSGTTVDCVVYTARVTVNDQQKVQVDGISYRAGEQVLIPYQPTRPDSLSPALHSRYAMSNWPERRPSHVAGLVNLANFSPTRLSSMAPGEFLPQRVEAHAIAMVSSDYPQAGLMHYQRGDRFWIGPQNDQSAATGRRRQQSGGGGGLRVLNLRTGDSGAVRRLTDLLFYPHVVTQQQTDFMISYRDGMHPDMTCRVGDFVTLGDVTRKIRLDGRETEIVFAINHRTRCTGFLRLTAIRPITPAEIETWRRQSFPTAPSTHPHGPGRNAPLPAPLPIQQPPPPLPDNMGIMPVLCASHLATNDNDPGRAEWLYQYADSHQYLEERRARARDQRDRDES